MSPTLYRLPAVAICTLLIATHPGLGDGHGVCDGEGVGDDWATEVGDTTAARRARTMISAAPLDPLW
jgi:hypothetical protein